MEEADVYKSDQIPKKTLDPHLERKHLSMLERLSNRNLTLLENSSARKFESSNSSSSFESTSCFLTHFSDSKESIESQLAESRLVNTTNPIELKSYLAKISASISSLEELVAKNSYFLPSYEVRCSLRTISDLKQNLEYLNSELLPKKKFTFKNKAAKKGTITEPKETESKGPLVILSGKPAAAVGDSPGFRNKENELLVMNFKGSEIGEFTLSDLTSCEVRLIGCINSLFLHRLRNCKVFAGPVMGSILIEEVEGCLFVLASHQIRIHNAKKNDFYLRVRSRPIIEDSNGVRFAPYCLRYQGIEDELKDAGLDEETGNWANVDDFRWLRAVQSPNWCVLPENKQLKNVDV